MSFSDNNPGRRFNGCINYRNPNGKCLFFEWIDPPSEPGKKYRALYYAHEDLKIEVDDLNDSYYVKSQMEEWTVWRKALSEIEVRPLGEKGRNENNIEVRPLFLKDIAKAIVSDGKSFAVIWHLPDEGGALCGSCDDHDNDGFGNSKVGDRVNETVMGK
ncbi:hypothetical protein IFM89_014402 [Coptis chinensis]|uniref:GRF-type domain-containing protein n=1 Tax=Coptis chinensis TaxID=261450 RepID=A0A835GXI0_9MAGN|nr:hypothetical protein IFM89_014402 [Coptis chinensis]